jgi:phenylalanyl-tRNA synthetase beta chain
VKVSLRWLADYIDLPTADPGEVKAALESLGHEVGGIEPLPADWSGVVIAEVLGIEPHPDADKVRVCTVAHGGDPIQVVCGAWNFEAGARVPFAVPGAVLPGDFRIGTRTIRGVTSNGMICSERELGLGDDHAGILVLEGDAPVGEDFAGYVELPDVVLDVEVTPNRPDAMSMIGIARDLAAHFRTTWRMPPVDLPVIPGAPSTAIRIDDPTGCFRFTARELRDVELGPSPLWMRRRLRAAGMRPISNAVDVTNYVMLELGHPLHAFDADRIAGDHLVVRRAEPGETLVTLDGVRRTLQPDDLVIADGSGPASLAGTMGGAESEVGEDTTRILLEAASWDPPTIMWMSRRHLLRSEASARFERGVDRELPLTASARAAGLLIEMGGGSVLAEPVDELAVPYDRRVIELPLSEVRRILGPGFDGGDVARLLASIELDVTGEDPLQVTVPGFRPDLERPIDLVEEVARLHGYGSFDERLPRGGHGGWTQVQRRTATLRETLVGAGLSQAVHLSFIGGDDLDAFGFPPDHEGRAVITVRNPLREEESKLRTTLLPGLLGSLRYNRSHGAHDVALFETGKVFFDRPAPGDERIPDQPDRLSFALVGGFGGSALGQPGRPADVYAATALWRLIADRLDLPEERWVLEPVSAPGFHPGRAAALVLDGSRIGTVGEIHPTTAAAYEIRDRVAAAELDLAPLVAPAEVPQLRTPSTFPRVEFDLAFLVPDATPARLLLEATTRAAGALSEEARVFDEYRGMDGGRKSVAIRHVLRAPDRTLTNEEVAPIRQAMIDAARDEAGAELRGES